MAFKVFVDGQEGTTGLRLLDYLSGRSDVELLRIAEDKRKDPAERFATVAPLRRALTPYATPQPSSARRRAAADRAPRRAVRLGIGLGALGLSLALGGYALRREPAAPGTERRMDRRIRHPRLPSREHHVGHVDTGHQQQESHGRQEHRHG